jgi:hypothetical protein
VFLHLDYQSAPQGDFILIRDMKPLLSEVIPAALQVCKNLVFVLPKLATVSDITILFTYYFTLQEKYEQFSSNLGN